MSETRRITHCPAFVLHRRAYRETSMIVDLFSRDHGRVAVVARGARSPKSAHRGALQPFQELLAAWMIRGELGTLTGAELAGRACMPAGDALLSGFYVNELILRLLRKDDPHPALFDMYRATLAAMAIEGANKEQRLERPLRLFEKRLLDELGYGLNAATDITTGLPVLPDTMYEYQMESGPAPAQSSAYGALLMPGSSLLSIADERLDDQRSLRDARRLLKAALDIYLDGRRLKVRDVARAMRH